MKYVSQVNQRPDRDLKPGFLATKPKLHSTSGQWLRFVVFLFSRQAELLYALQTSELKW